jgi:hypothetical protein
MSAKDLDKYVVREHMIKWGEFNRPAKVRSVYAVVTLTAFVLLIIYIALNAIQGF